jgi:hypothetical protein
VRPITGLVLGSVLIPLGLGISLTWLPSSVADAFEYGAATACPEPAANGSGCWTEVSAVVNETHVYPRLRGNSNWVVDLTDQFGRQRPQVAHRDVFNRLTPGEPVTVRFWKGRVALIHVPGSNDLPTDNEPDRQIGMASLTTVFTVLAGSVFFLGALGVHRHARSWTRSVSRDAWSDDLFDAVAPPARLWAEAIFLIGFVSLVMTTIAWGWFDLPLLPVAAITLGFTALGWGWLLHHRARTVMERRSLPRKPR